MRHPRGFYFVSPRAICSFRFDALSATYPALSKTFAVEVMRRWLNTLRDSTRWFSDFRAASFHRDTSAGCSKGKLSCAVSVAKCDRKRQDISRTTNAEDSWSLTPEERRATPVKGSRRLKVSDCTSRGGTAAYPSSVVDERRARSSRRRFSNRSNNTATDNSRQSGSCCSTSLNWVSKRFTRLAGAGDRRACLRYEVNRECR